MPELTKEQVVTWIETTEGEYFTRQELDSGVGIGTERGLTARRQIIRRLLIGGAIERHPSRLFVYRMADNQAPVIDWQSADISNIVPVKWPFQLEDWVTIYPKNIIVIAGTFNAGKTAFCLNFIAQNQHRVELSHLLPIEYFNSEMGPEEMKLRLSKFKVSDWSFVARERSSKFAKVINPNRINVIDFLEITDNFYLVAQEISEIFDKLDRGICLIAIQKKTGATMGRGAEFSLEKPRLYLSLDPSELTIIKGKNWAVEGINPNNQKFRFKLIQGYKFIVEV